MGPSNFGFSAGLTRFVAPYFGFGLDLMQIIFIDSPITFTEFALSGHMQLNVLPYRRFTPYLRASFGLDVFSHGGGVYGLWRGVGGFILRVGKQRQFAIRLGLRVAGDVPDVVFNRNFTCALTDTPCSLRLGLEAGFGLRFGLPDTNE